MKKAFFLLLCSWSLFGAEVLKVSSNAKLLAVSHDLTRRWQLNDKLCVIKNGKSEVCGTVIKVKENFSILKLKKENTLIARGDKVVFEVPEKKAVILVQPEIISDTSAVPSDPFHLLTIGGAVGLRIAYPSLHFQRIIEPNFSFGFMPSYLNIQSSSKTLTSVSLLATFNFYPKEFFKGFWVMAAGGVAIMSTASGNTEQQAAPFQAVLTIGYRFKLNQQLIIGVAGGVQYLKDPKFLNLAVNGTGFQPLVLADFGVNF
jgi:hypothetical protein